MITERPSDRAIKDVKGAFRITVKDGRSMVCDNHFVGGAEGELIYPGCDNVRALLSDPVV